MGLKILLLMLFSIGVLAGRGSPEIVRESPSAPSSVLQSAGSTDGINETSDSDASATPSLVSYFQNLTTYSPYNSHGSCGYVSLIQYLSYYDTFYCDSIIPEQFDRNQGAASSWRQAVAVSPGVLRQEYPEPYSDDNQTTSFYDFVQANKNSDFQVYLMSIQNSLCNNDATTYSCSIGMGSYGSVLSNIAALNDANFVYTYADHVGQNCKDTAAINWFDNYVKNLLSQGKPVILHIKSFDKQTDEETSYHSIVAYYYDANGMHANYGWGSADADRVIADTDDEYVRIEAAGVLDFANVVEEHSNNYNVDGAYYCGCLHHDHKYNTSFVSFSSKCHKAYCACGEYALRAHAILSGTTFVRNGYTYATCTDCGALVNLGTGKVLVHDSAPVQRNENGSYKRGDGIIVLEDQDLASYKAGTLVFYSLESEGLS